MKKLSDYTPSYNYCGVCGRVPQNDLEECNWAPIRWWDCDDGWKIGTLCRWCYNEVINDKPHPDDYAYVSTNMVADDINTDLDIIDALEQQGFF